MKNIYFEDEEILTNDLYFLCYMIERVANVLHCENPSKIEQDWIDEYNLKDDDFDITDVDRELAEVIPTPTQMSKVYQRLITDTMTTKENYVDGLIRVYNDPI